MSNNMSTEQFKITTVESYVIVTLMGKLKEDTDGNYNLPPLN